MCQEQLGAGGCRDPAALRQRRHVLGENSLKLRPESGWPDTMAAGRGWPRVIGSRPERCGEGPDSIIGSQAGWLLSGNQSYRKS